MKINDEKLREVTVLKFAPTSLGQCSMIELSSAGNSC